MSQPTAGNFDCARLQEIKVRLSALINPNEVKAAEYIPDVAPVTMVKALQDGRFTALEDPLKDNVYKAVWMDDCDDEAPGECDADDCVVSGDQIGTQCKDFELDVCFSKSFSVSEKKYRTLGNTISFDEEVSIQLAKKLKLMDEEYARRVISGLDSMVGTNLNTSPYSASGGYTQVPATAWNPDLFGYFAVTKARNKMPGMRLLLGGLMEQAFWKIGMETSNPEGASAARKVASLGQVYTDSFITEDVLGNKAAFLVSPSAIALVTKVYHSPYGAGREEISQGNKQIRYTITSPSTGIVYDAIYQIACIGGDFIHTWYLSTKGAVLTNAVFCNANRTGVIGFECV